MSTRVVQLVLFLFSLSIFADEPLPVVDHRGVKISTGDSTSTDNFFKGKDSTTFSLEKEGEHPEIILLEDTVTASLLTRAAKMKEKDSDRKAKMVVEPRVRMQFAGLAFKVDPKEPRMVIIHMIGRTQEVPVKARVLKSDLEEGKRIELTLPKQSKAVTGVGTVTGGGKLVIRYHANKDELEMIEASGTIDVKTWAVNASDAQSIKDAKGIRKDMERLPVRTGEE